MSKKFPNTALSIFSYSVHKGDFTDQMKFGIPITKNGIPLLTVFLGIRRCSINTPVLLVIQEETDSRSNQFLFLSVLSSMLFLVTVNELLPLTSQILVNSKSQQ